MLEQVFQYYYSSGFTIKCISPLCISRMQENSTTPYQAHDLYHAISMLDSHYCCPAAFSLSYDSAELYLR